MLSIVNIPQESASGWQEVLEEIKSRGVEKVGLFVFDDLTGLDTVIGKVFSRSMQQKCVLHFQRNINKHIRKTDREAFAGELKEVFNPDDVFYTVSEAVNRLREVLLKCKEGFFFKFRVIISKKLGSIYFAPLSSFAVPAGGPSVVICAE